MASVCLYFLWMMYDNTIKTINIDNVSRKRFLFFSVRLGRELNLAATLASQPKAGHSLNFIINTVIMTLGWGLFVGLAAESCARILLLCHLFQEEWKIDFDSVAGPTEFIWYRATQTHPVCIRMVPCSRYLRKMIFNYYDESYIHVKTKDLTTDWIHCAIGVFQACPLSCILFLAKFNLCLDLLDQHSHLGNCMKDSSTKSSVKAYADDHTLIARNPKDCPKVVNVVNDFLRWTRLMKARSSKCR